jgi:1,5-anhydro-D-fructose reductase (1,5-anhydro-D-mannitol-forming)
MQQVNWGIIGCGSVTELKSGPAFGKVEGSKVVAVMRRNGDKARDYALRHHIPRYYSDADALISDPDVNAVYVATPPSSHARYAVKVMESGKPVYVEKPMAATYSDCQLMVNTSVLTGMPLYVAYYRRFLPYFHKVREIIRHGDLGRILFVQAMLHLPPRTEDLDPLNLPWRVNPSIAGAGYFYDLACHQIDLFEWFFGLAREVSGSRFNRAGLYGAEDVVFGNIVYDSGVPLTASWCFATEHMMQKDIITVYGTAASLEFSTFGFTPVRITRSEGVDEFLPANPENIQYWFIRNMVEELQGKKQKTCNGESAMRTNEIMDIILGKNK